MHALTLPLCLLRCASCLFLPVYTVLQYIHTYGAVLPEGASDVLLWSLCVRV